MASEALENSLLLNRIFADALAPINQYSQNRLAIAQADLVSRRKIEEEGRRMSEAANIQRSRQTFDSAESKAEREFRKGQAEDYQEFIKGQGKEAREEAGKVRKESATREDLVLKTQNTYAIEMAKLRQKLDDDARKIQIEYQVDLNTARYWALDQESNALMKTMAESELVPISETNKVVRQVAERYSKDRKKLDQYLNPASAQDISQNLSLVLDRKDLQFAREDIEKGMASIKAPLQVRAEMARLQLHDVQLSKRALPNVDITKLQSIGRLPSGAGGGGGPDYVPPGYFGGQRGGGGQSEAQQPGTNRVTTPDGIKNFITGAAAQGSAPGGGSRTPVSPGVASYLADQQLPPELAGAPGGGYTLGLSISGIRDSISRLLPPEQPDPYSPGSPIPEMAWGVPGARTVPGMSGPPAFGPITPDGGFTPSGIGNITPQLPVPTAGGLPQGPEGVDLNIAPEVFGTMVQIALSQGLSMDQVREGLRLAKMGDRRAVATVNEFKRRALITLANARLGGEWQQGDFPPAAPSGMQLPRGPRTVPRPQY